MKKIKAYLVGYPLSTTASASFYTGVDRQIEYKNKQIKSETEFIDFVSAKKYDFINITAPFKKLARDILDQESEIVKRTGACNLIVNRNGVLHGYNTDFFGFRTLLLVNEIDVKDKKVLILGNGATSGTVEAVLNNLGASQIIKACRSIKNSSEVLFEDAPKDVSIIVNTTPVGYKPTDKKLIKINEFKSLETFIDCVHTPYRTETMIDAHVASKGAVGGFDMLFFQGMQAHSIATRRMKPIEYWFQYRREILLQNTNIVLTGMPTCGKSELIKKIHKFLNIKESVDSIVLDTDKIISEVANKSISDIFKDEGEEEFRRMEKNAVKIASRNRGIIIATGGGAILNEANYRTLARNGFIVYLKKTDFSSFKDDSKRPLVKTKEDLEKLYKARNPIYENRADLTLSSYNDADEFMEEVTNAICGY